MREKKKKKKEAIEPGTKLNNTWKRSAKPPCYNPLHIAMVGSISPYIINGFTGSDIVEPPKGAREIENAKR